MKRLTNYLTILMIAIVASLGMISCEDEPATPKAPLAFFSAEADAENSQLIIFTNETENGDSYVWDFGDGSATSTDENPTHEYADGGDYSVTLTATNEGGDNVYVDEISVIKNAAVNEITNGTFDDESGWTIINFYECENANGGVAIADGVAKFTETTNTDWKHIGIWQELTLDAGTYNVDMFVEYGGVVDSWGEVYVGATMPTACKNQADGGGTDYTDNPVLVAHHTWSGCNADYSGSAVENACNAPADGVNGQFTLETAGTYYFVYKTGGGSIGANGITIDDVTLFKQ